MIDKSIQCYILDKLFQMKQMTKLYRKKHNIHLSFPNMLKWKVYLYVLWRDGICLIWHDINKKWFHTNRP